MKKTILLPLAVGLLFAGCTRTQSDTNKVSANDQADPNKPTYQDSAITARKTTADQSKVAADPTITPNPATDPSVAAPATPAMSATPNNPVAAAETTSSNPTTKSESKTDLNARVVEWKLSADDIRSEVDSGTLTRSRMAGVDEPTGPMDDVLAHQVDGKLKDNSTTADLSLKATADHGTVTLTGSADSLEQIGAAVALSLDTPGVTKTISQIKLSEKKQ